MAGIAPGAIADARLPGVAPAFTAPHGVFRALWNARRRFRIFGREYPGRFAGVGWTTCDQRRLHGGACKSPAVHALLTREIPRLCRVGRSSLPFPALFSGRPVSPAESGHWTGRRFRTARRFRLRGRLRNGPVRGKQAESLPPCRRICTATGRLIGWSGAL